MYKRQAFKDIEELALQCRFSDCTHTSEPGCAVIKAVESGEISQERLNNYFKLKKEIVNTQNKLLHGHKFLSLIHIFYLSFLFL